MPLDGEWIRADVLRNLRGLLPLDTAGWAHLSKTYRFDLAALDDPRGVVPLAAMFGVYHDVAKQFTNDAMMFDLFYKIDIGRFSIFDYLFACAPTLRDACQAWSRFSPIRTNAYMLIYEETDSEAFFEWPILEGRGDWRQSMFARIAWATRQLEHALDLAKPPILIEIAAQAPEHSSAFLTKYQGRIRFNATRNRICFPISMMSHPLRQTDQNLYEIILRSATSELETFGQLSSPISRIANEVATGLAKGTCTLPIISLKLGMSQRAVQRLLEREGTTFRKLTEEIRRSAAERYLRSTDLPLKEIAFLLGFSELSTFSRAVKLWFGMSPRKVRETKVSDQVGFSAPCANEATGRRKPAHYSPALATLPSAEDRQSKLS